MNNETRPVIAAIANNMIVSADAPEARDNARLLTRADPEGFTVYRYTLVFMLAKCVTETFPGAEFRVRNSIGPALWCTIAEVTVPLADAVERLRGAMAALVTADLPIEVDTVSYKEAVDFFREHGRLDEENLLKHRNPPTVRVSRCGTFRALNQATLAPRTGVADLYELVAVDGGIALNVPPCAHPDALDSIPATAPYFDVFRRQTVRASITGVETVGDLNQVILDKKFDDLVRTVEALHTRELAGIAERIAARKPAVRLVLLAGPSSSGKTTTAHRLCTQLRVSGLKPMLLSTDDYFVGMANYPKDANGNPDFEHVKAVDAERLAADLNALFAGQTIHLRRYDFKKGAGYDEDGLTTMPSDGVVVLEGIHALNPDLTRDIADECKFSVYLNAMTQLVVDSCNRISASDTRLLRRLIRDFYNRGKSPLDTFALWPNVVAGERRWIYPYQGEADAVFNSSLDYELAVLKPFALELLCQVKPWDGAYAQACRLMSILDNVSLARPDAVPGDSILRETIGGSQLAY